MASDGHSKEKVNAVLNRIVLDKLKARIRLSRDEQWFYLTSILRVTQTEAERMMEKFRSDPEAGPGGDEEVPRH